MDQLERRTLKTARSLVYTYYASPVSSVVTDAPALFFIHGFPDNAHLWDDVVSRLLDLPCRFIVPDLLGYDGTSKPTDTSLFGYGGQADDLKEILDAEGVKSAIVIGHDWGSGMAQRFYLHHPERVAGLGLVNFAYLPPNQEQRFDLDVVNAMTEKMFGYPSYAYWELFTADDGPKILQENLSRFYEVLHGDEEEWMRKMFCVRGAMKEYLLGDKTVPLKAYAKEPRWKDSFLERFARDGFEAPVQWYKATKNNIQFESDRQIPKERLKITVPVLFIGCTGDAVCRVDFIEAPEQAGVLPDLEVKVMQCDHWSPMEKPDEMSQHIRDFLSRRYSQQDK